MPKNPSGRETNSEGRKWWRGGDLNSRNTTKSTDSLLKLIKLNQVVNSNDRLPAKLSCRDVCRDKRRVVTAMVARKYQRDIEAAIINPVCNKVFMKIGLPD